MKTLPSLLFFVSIAPAFAATIIYQDDFSGTTGTDLSGSSPDIRPGSETWSANAIFDFNGSNGVSLPEDGSNLSRAAYLPFTPQSGYLYDFQVTVAHAVTGANSRSLQMGFFGSASASLTGALTSSSANGPVIFLRQAGTYEGRAAGNSALTGFSGTLSDAVTNPHVLRITLDTSGVNWVMHTYMGGTEIGSGHTFTTNPTISAIGFSVNTSGNISAGGTFSDFILTAEQIPEPSAALLTVLSAASLLRRRR